MSHLITAVNFGENFVVEETQVATYHYQCPLSLVESLEGEDKSKCRVPD